ncbi:MAG: ATP-binding cassette domain-containing protein, partial [Rhodospirillaceae bacterium]|nr:ATP-binding cassette domain-containing protein [Rhodospirillaceae bacterium]
MADPGLELRAVCFAYGDWQVAYDLQIERGCFAALIGASGGGKSTLLALVAGFEAALSGEILVNGVDVTNRAPAQRPIMTLFQEHNLFPHLDAQRNVGLGLDPGLRLSREQNRDVAEALERVGLAGKEQRLPRNLSGGERQRVAIARALVMRRELLLLDEPFAALGPALRRDMLDLVDTLRRDTGMTVVMVSHDPGDARRVAQTTAFVHEGHILASSPTGELLD